jgi:glycosyltransferase involved in cell wall biosynthesis
MEPPFFSIIIPTLNCLKRLESTMASILGQQFRDFECLLLDARSKDGTREYAAEQARRDSRVRTWSEPDAGLFDAMNKGIRQAKGRYLYFLGAGDCLTENILGIVADRLAAEPQKTPIFLYGDVFWVSENSRYRGAFDRYKIGEDNVCHQSIFYDRRIFEMLGEYELLYFALADWVFNIKCFGNENISKIYVNQIIANYEGNGFSSRSLDTAFVWHRPFLVLKYLGFFSFLNLLWKKAPPFLYAHVSNHWRKISKRPIDGK